MEAFKGKLEKIMAEVLQLKGLMKVAKGKLDLQLFRKDLKKDLKEYRDALNHNLQRRQRDVLGVDEQKGEKTRDTREAKREKRATREAKKERKRYKRRRKRESKRY